MEVVSTSNLVSFKTKYTTGIFCNVIFNIVCNFQNDCGMRDKIGRYVYIQIWSYSSFHDSKNVKEHLKKDIYTIQQNQNQPAIS